MTQMHILQDLVIIFAVSLVVVIVLRRLGFPSIAGFILAGVLIGPNALGLIAETEQVEQLAEVGVVLLLFGIGLELSLDIMRRLLRPILFGGALQVGASILITVLIASWLGQPLGTSIFLGSMIAVSSTAIVLGGLRIRGELEAPHGRLTLGILIFQDLCVVPMLLVLPFLAGSSGSVGGVLTALGISAVILVIVVFGARIVVPRLLGFVADTRQRDLFVLTVFLVCAATAWLLSLAGLSLALGAFMAGLVVAGSEYRHQALAELVPFREVLTSIFFVSVGMLFNPQVLMEMPVLLPLLLGAVMSAKFLIVFLTALVMRLPLRVCILAGAALSQVGEFSFVLMHGARENGLIDPPLNDTLNAVVILSMIIAPIVISTSPHFAAGVGKLGSLTRRLGVRTPQEPHVGVRHMENHVIIAGYGMTGQEVAQSLKELEIPYVITDLNSENVRAAVRRKEPAFFGDITSPEVLRHLGVSRARELILVVNDPNGAVRAIKAVLRVAPKIPILVRARYLGDEKTLLDAGATEVITAEFEAALEVTQRVLVRRQLVATEIKKHLERIRARHSNKEKS